MKKILFIILILLMFSINIFSQDYVYFKTGYAKECKVVSVNPKTVEVINLPVKDSVKIELKTINIEAIKYSDGRVLYPVKDSDGNIKIINKEKIKENKKTKTESTPEEKDVVPEKSQPEMNTRKNKEYIKKMAKYVNGRKDPAIAGILSTMLTSLGHAYTDNWSKGLKFTAGRIGFGYGIFNAYKEGNNPSLWWIGEISLSIWEIIDAMNLARKYNDKLYNSIFNKLGPLYNYQIHIYPTRNGTVLSLSYSF